MSEREKKRRRIFPNSKDILSQHVRVRANPIGSLTPSFASLRSDVCSFTILSLVIDEEDVCKAGVKDCFMRERNVLMIENLEKAAIERVNLRIAMIFRIHLNA